MDNETREYRKKQFEKVATKSSEYSPKIKIVKENESTNWFDISEEELQKIVKILTK